MKQTIKKFSLSLMALAMAFISQAQTVKVPAPSPLQTLKQNFALSEITIEYSRPSARGRAVYGDVVPFGKVWRTGANGSTKITFGEDVKVEGKAVKAGTYALYSIPGKDSFTFMLYKDLKLGGDVANYSAEDELIRFAVNSSKLTEKVETFTINVADITATSSNIELTWENTRAGFNVTADIDASIMASIDKALNKDNKPYYQAASYYYDNNKDLKVALEWVNKATEQNPKAYWVMLLKAKIELKLKDKAAAKASAEKVIEMAKADKDDAYVKNGENLLIEINKLK
jgi:tetratricopeptide (TPR) repeat protein